MPTFIIFGFVCSRLMFFKFFYESILLGALKGWAANKPLLMLDEKTSFRDWKMMKKEVDDWITFYKDVAVSVNC